MFEAAGLQLFGVAWVVGQAFELGLLLVLLLVGLFRARRRDSGAGWAIAAAACCLICATVLGFAATLLGTLALTAWGQGTWLLVQSIGMIAQVVGYSLGVLLLVFGVVRLSA
jgi:hypothetical protein